MASLSPLPDLIGQLGFQVDLDPLFLEGRHSELVSTARP